MIAELSRVLPKFETLERFDGSKWKLYDIEGGKLVLTENGQTLLAKDSSLRGALRSYRHELLNPPLSPVMRRPFRHGGNSDVFEVGETGLVVKEAGQGQSVWFALERLDYLYRICKDSLPPYIRVPEHYGAVFSSNLSRQYLLMEKVNDGTTVEDFTKDAGNTEQAAVVQGAFDKAKILLDKAIDSHAKAQGYPDRLLVDWHEGNVIVDFDSPVEEMPFTLWIIDQ